MAHFILALSLVILLVAETTSQQQCFTVTGDAYFDLGEAECVLLTPYYQDYQWATCSTDDYIMRSSDQSHNCRGGRGTVCWYQCMLEINGIDQGPVYNNCRCSPDEPTEAPTTDLSLHCYSPSGDDCSWYRECLEERYPCEGTDDGYAIEYAEKFCNLYSSNYNDFSTDGRAWIDGVRKCLQVVLVPSLRPWVSKTCKDIRRDAFDSHVDCYITPASEVPGICELSCGDIWRSFWLVSYEGGAFTSAPIETGKQMLSVMVGCFKSGPLSGCIQDLQTTLLVAVPFVSYDRLTVAAKVVDFIASKLDWIANEVRWFPFLGDDNSSDSDSRRRRQITDKYTSINVLLVDTKALNILNKPTPGQGNLDQVVKNFATAVHNGLLSEIPLVLNDTQMIMEVLSVGQCTDILCSSTNVTKLAIAPPTGGVKNTLFEQSHMTVICIIMLLHLCVGFVY